MIKYCDYLFIFSSFLILVNNCINSKTIIESEFINSMPFNGSNYLKVLSLVDLSTTSKPYILNTTKLNNKSTQMIANINLMRNYLSKELPPYECQIAMNRFGKILSEFIQCLLINEVPFNICLNCVEFYGFLYGAYKELTNSSISKCPHSFLNSDKISLINKFYINSITQWTEGNCDNCYQSIVSKDDPNFQINNDTIYYYYLSNNYVKCVKDREDTNLTNTTCVACEEAFDTVNDYYDSITSNYTSQVCYDIVDSMKDIRQQWSSSLECPVNTSRTLHILIVIMIVLMLPFALYLTGRIFCHGNHKTLMRQKRLATSYKYGCVESQPLINPMEK